MISKIVSFGFFSFLISKKFIVFVMSTFRVCFSFGLKSVGSPLSTISIVGVTFPCVCWVMASFMVLVNSRQILNLYLEIKLFNNKYQIVR